MKLPLILLTLSTLTFCGCVQKPKTVAPVVRVLAGSALQRATSVAIGYTEASAKQGEWKLTHFVYLRNKSLVETLKLAMMNQELSPRRTTPLEGDIYAVMLSSSGVPVMAAAFNNGKIQPFDCKLEKGHFVLRESAMLPAPDYWGMAPGLDEILRENWREKQPNFVSPEEGN